MIGLIFAIALAQQPAPQPLPPDPVAIILAREGCVSSEPWGCTEKVVESRAEAQATFDRLAARNALSPAEQRLEAALTLALGVMTTNENYACLGERSVNEQYGRKRVTGNCPEDR